MRIPSSRTLFAMAMAATCTIAGAAGAVVSPTPLNEAELDALAGRTMTTFQVPGLALAVVKDGVVVHAKGYGVRELGKSGRVDADTLFGIASNSKGFTAAALALLVDRGTIKWEDKVTAHLPEFELYDPYVTREFTIRDLLTHRSGLPLGAGDLLWWPNGQFSPAEVLSGLKHLKPSASFRSEFSYNNMLYAVAGEIVARVSGSSWSEFIETQLMAPLNMQACAGLRSRLKTPGITALNISNPHAMVDGKQVPMRVAGNDFETGAAAAGVVCNVKDLAKWVQFHLAVGRTADGSELLSPRQHRSLWTAQTVLGVSATAILTNKVHLRAYGLGYFLEDYHGYLHVSHDGTLPGMVSYISMLPELKLGVIVLTNQYDNNVTRAIASQIQMAYLGGENRDFVAQAKLVSDKANAEATTIEQEIGTVLALAMPAPMPLAQYVGTYRDAWRGDVLVSEKNGQLRMKFSRTDRLEGSLQHYKNGVFVVRWDDRTMLADAYVRFLQNNDGEVSAARMEALSPRTDFSFDFHNLELKKQAQKN